MVESLTEMMHREWNLVNTDNNDYNNGFSTSHQPRVLSRKISDNNNNNNNNNSNNQHHQSTSNYHDPSTLVSIRTPKPLTNQKSLDISYDTDGGLGVARNRTRHHHHSDNNYDYLISPRLPVRRNGTQSSKQTTSIPLQQRVSQKMHFVANASSSTTQNHDEKNEESNYDNDAHRQRLRLSRRSHQTPTPPTGNHATTRVSRSTPVTQRHSPLAATPSVQPLRIIFMRHSERANQALGPDWYSKAFRTNTYKAYDQNLPFILPKRRFDQAYEFDAPLTVRGLKIARVTGRAMVANNLIVDLCLSSTALRCVQTCERVLTGMERRDRIPIRIEPGLFECPHYNQKIVDSFMSKKELVANRYNIKQDYRSIISQVNVPETLEEYFERSHSVMRGIIDRYGHYGGTILIVTHAPGLLALTDAVKGLKPTPETFYRTVSTYPPLAMYIAEYEGLKWKFSEQPFNLVPTEQ